MKTILFPQLGRDRRARRKPLILGNPAAHPYHYDSAQQKL